MYPVTLVFSDDYPSKAPECHLPANFFHPKCDSSTARRLPKLNVVIATFYAPDAVTCHIDVADALHFAKRLAAVKSCMPMS